MLVDPETIEKAQRGDAAAFNEIVRAYRKRILGTIYRLIGRREDVEDVGQEVFVRLYYSLDQLRSPKVFEPWLYRLTANAAYDHLRRRRRRRTVDVPMADLSDEQAVAVEAAQGGKRQAEEERRAEAREMVEILLGEVSEKDRILLTLKEIQGLSLREMAQIYSVNENALKVRLFRARRRVLRAYEDLKKRRAI